MLLRMLDLFSGIGGFSLAASWTGAIETVAFCEIEPWCQKVLQKNFPGIPIHPDITKLRGENIGAVDIVCGGFPCQPFSIAGKRRGKEDDRYLWPEMLRVIQETKPTWVVGENVTNLLRMGIEKTLSDLEYIGYSGGVLQIPACGVDANHTRDRLFIVAYSTSKRWRSLDKKQPAESSNKHPKDIIQAWASETNIPFDLKRLLASSSGQLCRNDDGLSEGVDRLRGLGNAIVPQAVYPIFQAIVEIERREEIYAIR